MHMSKFKLGTVEKNSSTIGPSAGITEHCSGMANAYIRFLLKDL